MIIDTETNKLFLSDLLLKRFSNFYKELESCLLKNNINYSLLPYTKDIWVVDFMPIQIQQEKFIQFDYSPDYLKGFKKWRKTISPIIVVCI